jgi:hypothetical protein
MARRFNPLDAMAEGTGRYLIPSYFFLIAML